MILHEINEFLTGKIVIRIFIETLVLRTPEISHFLIFWSFVNTLGILCVLVVIPAKF